MMSQTPKVKVQIQPNQRPQFDMDSRVQQPGQNDENYKPLTTTHVTTHSTPASQPLGFQEENVIDSQQTQLDLSCTAYTIAQPSFPASYHHPPNPSLSSQIEALKNIKQQKKSKKVGQSAKPSTSAVTRKGSSQLGKQAQSRLGQQSNVVEKPQTSQGKKRNSNQVQPNSHQVSHKNLHSENGGRPVTRGENGAAERKVQNHEF